VHLARRLLRLAPPQLAPRRLQGRALLVDRCQRRLQLREAAGEPVPRLALGVAALARGGDGLGVGGAALLVVGLALEVRGALAEGCFFLRF